MSLAKADAQDHMEAGTGSGRPALEGQQERQHRMGNVPSGWAEEQGRMEMVQGDGRSRTAVWDRGIRR